MAGRAARHARTSWRRASARGPIPPQGSDQGAADRHEVAARSTRFLTRQLRAAALVGGLVAVAGGGAYTLISVGHAALDVAGTLDHVASGLGLDLPAPLTHVTVPGSPTAASGARRTPATKPSPTAGTATPLVRPVVLPTWLTHPAPSPQPRASASPAPRVTQFTGSPSWPGTPSSQPSTPPSIPSHVKTTPTPDPTKGGHTGGDKGGHGAGNKGGHGKKGHGGKGGGHVITGRPPHIPTIRLPIGLPIGPERETVVPMSDRVTGGTSGTRASWRGAVPALGHSQPTRGMHHGCPSVRHHGRAEVKQHAR